jgi:hypothetical protein
VDLLLSPVLSSRGSSTMGQQPTVQYRAVLKLPPSWAGAGSQSVSGSGSGSGPGSGSGSGSGKGSGTGSGTGTGTGTDTALPGFPAPQSSRLCILTEAAARASPRRCSPSEIVLVRGEAGPAQGHTVHSSSFFDRMWTAGKKTRRWFLHLQKVVVTVDCS